MGQGEQAEETFSKAYQERAFSSQAFRYVILRGLRGKAWVQRAAA